MCHFQLFHTLIYLPTLRLEKKALGRNRAIVSMLKDAKARVYECVAGRIKRNKCAAVGGGSGKCNERGMGRETDLHRERESDGGGGAE